MQIEYETKEKNLTDLIGNDEIVGEIITTKNYKLFRFSNENRDVSETHVNKLINSFEEKYLLTPIIVDENHVIIDGQHRFKAAENLGYSINYVVCKGYGLRDIQLLNANMSNWKKIDFLKSYSESGLEPYKQFNLFKGMFPKYSHMVREMLLTKCGENKTKMGTENFNSGGFKVSDYEKAVKFGDMISDLDFYGGYNRVGFVSAILQYMQHEKYDHENMISNLTKYGLKNQSTVENYMIKIQIMYNKKLKENKKIRII